VERYLAIYEDTTISEGLRRITQSGKKCIVFVDEEGQLVGTLSDGDLRKAISGGSDLEDSIARLIQKNATVLEEGNYSVSEAQKLFLENKFDLIPVIDSTNRVVEILTWAEVFSPPVTSTEHPLNVPVVIMAGGRGTRLDPFTKILPKPLVPIHEKPVIEHIIERFLAVGIRNFFVTVNYKSRILKAYFEELQEEYSTVFVDEKTPLGTAGGLSFLKSRIKEDFFVANCDVVVEVDLRHLYSQHVDGKYDITLVVSERSHIMPYGVCNLGKDGDLVSIDEKPNVDLLVNVGLYVVNPAVFKLIPREQKYDFTELVCEAIAKKYRVGVFRIKDQDWVDVGQWAEYSVALERL
jgi:dTDP-glucose pyrophosphorylase